MSQFMNTKLSKILARMIIKPEDRSQLLPLATPIYCPDNKGVRANKVSIINPNKGFLYQNKKYQQTIPSGNKDLVVKMHTPGGTLDNGFMFFNDAEDYFEIDLTDFVSSDPGTQCIIECDLWFRDTKNAGNNDFFYTYGSNYSNYAVFKYGHLNSFTWMNASLSQQINNIAEYCQQNPIHFKGVITYATNGRCETQHYLTINGTTYESQKYSSEYQTIESIFKNSKIVKFGAFHVSPGVKDLKVTIGVPVPAEQEVTTTDRTLGTNVEVHQKIGEDGTTISSTGTSTAINSVNYRNITDITLDKSLKLTYTVPYEVDLETDVDLLDLIKSDMAVNFRKLVSNSIRDYIAVSKDTITKVPHGTHLTGTLGAVIADNISNGSGQKFSVFRYSNGAPVAYIQSSAQPEIDKEIQKKPEVLGDECVQIQSNYALIDDINVPALYYCEQPTLILPTSQFQEYMTGRVNGEIKDFVDRKLNVDTAEINLTDIGEGIYGSNDCFAVAFTEPKIVEASNQDFYAKDICIEICYGIELINPTNLRIIE